MNPASGFLAVQLESGMKFVLALPILREEGGSSRKVPQSLGRSTARFYGSEIKRLLWLITSNKQFHV
jgi:hypothetical protein